MNAKKIMGAVLVALLALTAFAGVGAAADGIPTIFVYQTASGYTGTWINEEDGVTKITFDSNMVIGKNIKEGIYVNATDGKIYVSYPTGIVNGNAIGGTVAAEGQVDFTGATGTNGVANVGLIFTSPSGVVSTTFSGKDFSQTTTSGGSFSLAADVESGLWKVQTYFGKTTLATANGLPTEFWAGKDVYTFTIAPTDVTITADKDSVVQGNPIKITVTGTPKTTYDIKVSGGKLYVYPGQPNVGASGELPSFAVTTGDNGKITFSVKSDKKGDFTIAVWKQSTPAPAEAEAEVEVTVEKGELTAESVEDSYIIGTKMKLTGTNSVGGDLLYFIAGTNYDLTELSDSEFKKDGTAWSVTLAFPAGADLPDAGTYTIYVTTATPSNLAGKVGDDLEKAIKEAAYTTVSVALKQPFLSVTEAPEIVVQGAEAEIKGTAEATSTLAVYLFGTNYFNAATNADASSRFGADYLANGVEFIEVKKNAFTITLNESLTESLAAGQYFMVIQHPMYDKLFNIYATADNISVAATEGNALAAGTALFDVKDRQKANAAQALCDELDAQKIDDMYVKLSFIVAAGTSTINPIPAEVAQGTKLTVSGSTNLGEGELVTVEMLSTAFAAVPKETVGSASFISLITKTDKDGNWEVTFDTSNLNVDEYTVTAAVEGFGASTTKVNVVEAADEPVTPPTDKPDEPVTPPQDDAPETPGFGALAALAGLGAVAVLLLRRE